MTSIKARVAVFTLVTLAVASASGLAQIKGSKTYEDRREGFALKVPRNWDQIPPQPEELNTLAKWAADTLKRGGRIRQTWELRVLRFERRGGVTAAVGGEERPAGGAAPGTDDEGAEMSRADRFKAIREANKPETFKDWCRRNEGIVELPKPDGVVKVKDRVWNIYKMDKMPRWRTAGMMTGVYHDGTYEWAVMFIAPGDEIINPKRPRQKTKAVGQILKTIKSFRTIERKLENKVRDPDAGEMTEWEKKIEEVKKRLPKHWHVEPTPSRKYVVVHNIPRKKTSQLTFAKNIRRYLDNIRLRYEELFPPRKEITTVAIVRVCQDREEYFQYGGPPGSAGYFSPSTGELVIYDASKEGGKADSYSTLFHEAFHQYIYHAVGEVSAHRWFDEGYGDYFAGANPKKKFRIEKFDWRTGTVKNAVATGNNVHLSELIRYTKAQYYSNAGICYSQGWALVYFLNSRVAKKNERWAGILERYFDTLVEMAAKDKVDLDKAVDIAFEGVDIDELDAAYVEFIKRGFK